MPNYEADFPDRWGWPTSNVAMRPTSPPSRAILLQQPATESALMPERFLHGPELLQLGAQLVAPHGILGVGHVLLGILDLGLDHRGIDLLHRRRPVGHDGEPVWSDLGEAAHYQEALLTGPEDLQYAGSEHRDQRRVP